MPTPFCNITAQFRKINNSPEFENSIIDIGEGGRDVWVVKRIVEASLIGSRITLVTTVKGHRALLKKFGGGFPYKDPLQKGEGEFARIKIVVFVHTHGRGGFLGN